MSVSTISYPFDPTGLLPSNKIVGEQQILNLPTISDFHFIVPNYAPYFSQGLIVTIRQTDGTIKTCTEGIDFYCTHQFVAASRACSAPIYGSISFLDLTLKGVVTLTYQTLGGIWTIDPQQIEQILSDTLHNPRVTTWDQVTNQPVTFPVINHQWDLTDLVGASAVVAELQNIENAIRQKTLDNSILMAATNAADNATTTANAANAAAQTALAAVSGANPQQVADALNALQNAVDNLETNPIPTDDYLYFLGQI